jgi:hypothetical protein
MPGNGLVGKLCGEGVVTLEDVSKSRSVTADAIRQYMEDAELSSFDVRKYTFAFLKDAIGIPQGVASEITFRQDLGYEMVSDRGSWVYTLKSREAYEMYQRRKDSEKPISNEDIIFYDQFVTRESSDPALKELLSGWRNGGSKSEKLLDFVKCRDPNEALEKLYEIGGGFQNRYTAIGIWKHLNKDKKEVGEAIEKTYLGLLPGITAQGMERAKHAGVLGRLYEGPERKEVKDSERIREHAEALGRLYEGPSYDEDAEAVQEIEIIGEEPSPEDIRELQETEAEGYRRRNIREGIPYTPKQIADNLISITGLEREADELEIEYYPEGELKYVRVRRNGEREPEPNGRVSEDYNERIAKDRERDNSGRANRWQRFKDSVKRKLGKYLLTAGILAGVGLGSYNVVLNNAILQKQKQQEPVIGTLVTDMAEIKEELSEYSPEAVAQYVEIFLEGRMGEYKSAVDATLEELGYLKTSFDELGVVLGDRIGVLENQLTDLGKDYIALTDFVASEFDDTESLINGLDSRVAGLGSDIGGLYGTLGALKVDINDLSERSDIGQDMLEEIINRVGGIEGKVKKIEGDHLMMGVWGFVYNMMKNAGG